MASIRKKDRSPFWYACFMLPNGIRTQRSTGATDRRKAQRIAAEFELTSREASEGRFIESRARKAIADIYALGCGEELGSSSTGDFLDGWLARKRLETGEATGERYATIIQQFKEFLGSKGGGNITSITAAEFNAFRNHLAKRVSTGTANLT